MFAQQDEEKEKLVPLCEHSRQPRSRWRHLERALAIVGATFLLLGTALAVGGSFKGPASASEPGWTTAIGPDYPSLSTEKVRFDAGLALDEAGNLFRTNDEEDARQFVGKPNKEIDANWELLVPSDTNITRAEAEEIGGDFYFFPGTDTTSVEFSTPHILHCLNMIRMSVYADHYWPKGVEEAQRIHVDHCIDALREYIQCHVDLTPIHIVWSKNKGGVLPDFTQSHTCRSFRQAHEWILRRNIANFEHGMGDKGVAIDAQETLEKLGWT